MSFFGFDTTLPRDRPKAGRDKGERPFVSDETFDPNANLSADDDDDLDAKLRAHLGNKEDMAVYTWGEEDYDGLGDHLEEEGDAFNDDTFGGGGVVGKLAFILRYAQFAKRELTQNLKQEPTSISAHPLSWTLLLPLLLLGESRKLLPQGSLSFLRIWRIS